MAKVEVIIEGEVMPLNTPLIEDKRRTFNQKLLYLAAVTSLMLVTFYLGWFLWTVIS